MRRAKVVADFATRRELIRAGVIAAAAASGEGGTALIEDALLDEVTALVEWPVPIAGRFEQRFLSLPREVVIATVQDHQRYFAVQGADGKLSGWFITVSNIESRDPDKVREGNERVVRPRLSDAAFFWEQDLKISLDAQAARLSGMIFQTRLGSYADKTQRVRALAQMIGERIGAGSDVARAAELAKADLMTAMVGEFPGAAGHHGPLLRRSTGRTRRIGAGVRGALPTAVCRRRLARDQDRPGRSACRQDRHVGRHLRHRAAADRRARIPSVCGAPPWGCCASCSKAGWIWIYSNCWKRRLPRSRC